MTFQLNTYLTHPMVTTLVILFSIIFVTILLTSIGRDVMQ